MVLVHTAAVDVDIWYITIDLDMSHVCGETLDHGAVQVVMQMLVPHQVDMVEPATDIVADIVADIVVDIADLVVEGTANQCGG